MRTLLPDQNFVDPFFAPIEQSIVLGGKAMKKVVHWRRPKDFLDCSKYHMFDDLIEPNDIM